MRSSTGTFTRAARREQLIRATIDTVAELGLPRASLSQIAARIGIAKGGIIYHFSSKNELITAVLQDIFARLSQHLVARMSQATDPADALRIYIVALVEYLDRHRNEVQLISEGFAASLPPETADAHVDSRWRELAALIDHAAEHAGRGDVDSTVLAVSLSGAVDALVSAALRDPEFDLEHAGARLADMAGQLVAPVRATA